jgi:hypothetical protein
LTQGTSAFAQDFAIIEPLSQNGSFQERGSYVSGLSFPGAFSAGKVVAIIDVTEDYSAYQLPAGSTAQVAVYTDHWREVALVRRILLRMKSWNYVTLES